VYGGVVVVVAAAIIVVVVSVVCVVVVVAIIVVVVSVVCVVVVVAVVRQVPRRCVGVRRLRRGGGRDADGLGRREVRFSSFFFFNNNAHVQQLQLQQILL
jgi:hypothetical protein